MLKKEIGAYIASLRTDRGGEFTSNEFVDVILRNKGQVSNNRREHKTRGNRYRPRDGSVQNEGNGKHNLMALPLILMF